MPKKVDIIVINWNSGDMTLRAIQPYFNYNSSSISCNIIIVDNASSDNSVNLLEGHANKIIANTENLGFSKACNQAFVYCHGDYILLLNPDTTSDPRVLEQLVSFLEKNPEYGITGPTQIGKSGEIARSCGRFPTFTTTIYEVLGLSKVFPYTFTPTPLMLDWDHSESKAVDHVIGSYMLIRKSILDKIGLMNEDYFMYMEDLDLSLHFAQAGFKTFYNTNYSINHDCGGTGQKIKFQRLFYSLTSRATYWKNHFTKYHYVVLTTLTILVEPFLRVLDSLLKERKLNIKTIGKAYWLYFKNL